ncbi:glycosyltransferase [Amycolatopsis thermoflava]
MKVLLLTHGTRGDVQPFVTLAEALTAAGHDVVLAVPAASAPLASGTKAEVVPVDDGPNRMLEDPALRRALDTNYRGFRGKLLAVRVMREINRATTAVLADLATAAEGGADVVVHNISVPGHHVAERLGVPAVTVCLQPTWVPTSAFTNPVLPWRLPRFLNRASYLASSAGSLATRKAVLRWRNDRLRLPGSRLNPLRGAPAVLQAFSPLLLPAEPDYPSTVHTTGFWLSGTPAAWEPPRHLADFLAAGPAVYIGFGSMAGSDPEKTSAIVAESIRLSGVRAIVAGGWGGLREEKLGDAVCFVDHAPHDWLLPRTTVTVHHGGSGTTAAALAAGRPQVVCPFVADQPFHARRVHELGVAPPPQPQRAVTATSLASALTDAISDTEMAERARLLGRQIRSENGTSAAVRIIEDVVEGTA